MDLDTLAQQWHKGLRINHIGHSVAASRFKKRDSILGSSSAILSAIVATSLFAFLSDTANEKLKLLTGIISVLAAISAAANTFLNYGELAEQHRQAAVSFGSLRRRMELLNLSDDSNKRSLMDKLREDWEELEKQAPVLPPKVYAEAAERVG